jgi:hypothetical protein
MDPNSIACLDHDHLEPRFSVASAVLSGTANKKTDVANTLRRSDHVGLRFNGPPVRRVALHLVVRRIHIAVAIPAKLELLNFNRIVPARIRESDIYPAS